MSVSVPSTDSIRVLVGRYHLGYYFNPGGCEFFSPAHPSIRHCQTSDYGDEEDCAKLASWCAQHDTVLTEPRLEPYVWYSEGQFPVRVIKGRYFHRCTLACETEPDGLWVQEFDDIEETEKGWRLRCVTRNEGSAVYVFINPETPEARAAWEARLFTDQP